jgi:hypothetical protein
MMTESQWANARGLDSSAFLQVVELIIDGR